MKGRYDIIFLVTKQMQNQMDAEYRKNYLTADGVICRTGREYGIPTPFNDREV